MGNATPSQSMEQLGPSHKCPKWLMKTLESVFPYEVGKTETRSSARQDNGGDVVDSNQVMSMIWKFHMIVN
jgi:hypothetical protein